MIHKNLATSHGDISNMFVDLSVSPSAYLYRWEGKGRRVVRGILSFFRFILGLS